MKKKFLLLIISIFLFISNVKALTFNVDVTNIEEIKSGRTNSISNIDISNKNFDILFYGIDDEVNFKVTVTNTGNKAGTLKSVTASSTNNKIIYTPNLPTNGISIDANGTNNITITAKVLPGAQIGTSTSKIKFYYKYNEGSCPNGELLSEDESMCLCPTGKERNQDGICVTPESPVECLDGEVLSNDGTTCQCPTGKEKNQDGICVTLVSPVECLEDEVYNINTNTCDKKEIETIIPNDSTKYDIKPELYTPSNPKTMDNILVILSIFFISGVGLYMILFTLMKEKKKRIISGIIIGVITVGSSLMVLGNMYGIDNILGSIINSVEKSDEIIINVNETISQEDVYVYFFNTSIKSDAILIKSGNETMIIDGGDRRKRVTTNEGSIVVENGFIDYIKNTLGITKIDKYVGTHGHPDHVELAGSIIKEFDIHEIYVPSGDIPENTPVVIINSNEIKYRNTSSEWFIEEENTDYLHNVYKNYTISMMLSRAESAEERQAIENATIHYLDASSNTFSLGKSTFKVLNPLKSNWPTNIPQDTSSLENSAVDLAAYRDENDTEYTYSPINSNSLLLRMDSGRISYLFGADVVDYRKIGEIEEAYSGEMKADIYKNGHHHSKINDRYGEPKQRMTLIDPKIVVLSADGAAPFEAFDGISNENMRIYSVNCSEDAIIIKSDGVKYSVERGIEYEYGSPNCTNRNKD